MDIKALLLIILGGVLANNYALTQLLGVTPLLGFSGKGQKTLAMGILVAVVTVVSAAILWPVQTYVLAANALEHLQVPVFLLVIACVVCLADLLASKLLRQPLKGFAPIVALNSAVLGAAVNSASAGYGYAETLAASIGIGLGFLAALLVLAGVREKINERYVPAPFRGLPIALISAAILSMALMAF